MPRKERTTYSDGTTPRICIVGTGHAGLCSAIQLRRKLNISTIKIFEKNHDVGGVWLKNIYPGVQSDAPGHAYSFSFEPSPEWKSIYTRQPEMWQYIQGVAKKYELYSFIQFNTSVISAIWSEKEKIWRVTTVQNGTGLEQTEEFEIVILGTGKLRNPNIPEEFKAFEGPMFHSSEWNYSVPIENKVVGMVGNGASGIQVGPAIAPKTKQLIVYQRSPGYMIPKHCFRIGGLTKLLFRIFPFLLWLFRTSIFLACETYGSCMEDGIKNRIAEKFCLRQLNVIKDKSLRKSFIPNHKFGCRLILISSGFYEMFNRPNVKLVSNKIVKIEGRTVTTDDGRSETLDVLVLCTGFKVQDFFAPIKVLGVGGVDVLEMWKQDRPRAYFGVTCVETPNLFFVDGPNANVPYYTVLFMIECEVNLIVKIIREMLAQDAASVQVTLKAQTECMNQFITDTNRKVWATQTDSSWLYNEKGIPTAFWPNSATDFWRKTKVFDKTRFNFVPRKQILPQIRIEKPDVKESLITRI